MKKKGKNEKDNKKMWLGAKRCGQSQSVAMLLVIHKSALLSTIMVIIFFRQSFTD
jgi:hypothetical protein